MQNRKTIILIGVLILVITPFVLFTLSPHAQDRNLQQQDDDPPTPIQLGVVTEKQKKHSKFYKSVSKDTKKDFERRDLIALSKKDKKGIRILNFGEDTPPNSDQPLPSQEEFLQKNICLADTIVLGRITAKSSQLTEDHSLVFTDYEFTVNEVFRNSLSSNINPSGSITLTRKGGAVEVEDRVIDYVIKSTKRLKTGRTYLFFLKYLPDSDSFTIFEPAGVFEVTGNQIKLFSDAPLPYLNPNEDISNLTSFIRNATSQCHSNGE